MQAPSQTFNIVPKLPPTLEPLREIVYHLWWSWRPANTAATLTGGTRNGTA